MNETNPRQQSPDDIREHAMQDAAMRVVEQRLDVLVKTLDGINGALRQVSQESAQMATFMRQHVASQDKTNDRVLIQLTKLGEDQARLSERLYSTDSRMPSDVMPSREISQRFTEHDRRLQSVEVGLEANGRSMAKLDNDVTQLSGKITSYAKVAGVLWAVATVIIGALVRFYG